MKKPLLPKNNDRKIVLEAISDAKILLRSRHPHISLITPTEEDIEIMIPLYVNKKYVDYCAKFEEVFRIVV